MRAVLGVVYLLAQAKDLTTLVGTLCVAHLQGHGGIVTFVCPQLCVVNVLPGPWSCRAHLAVTLVGAHLEADGQVVPGGQDMVFGVVQMPSGAGSGHARLAGTFVGAHQEPGDVLAHLHGGIIRVSPLLL